MRHAIGSKEFTSPVNLGSSAREAEKLQQPTTHSDDAYSLREIIPNAQFFCGDDVWFDGVATTAKNANAGELVVHRIGIDDPIQVTADAIARGAAGILTEQVLPCPLPQCIVGDIELAMAKLASQVLQTPDQRLLTIGILGSAGKTCTGLLIANLLRAEGTRTAYQTDLGHCDGVVQTTPDHAVASGESLIHWLSEAEDAQCHAAVIEINDDDARHGLYESVHFDVLVITGSSSQASDFGPCSLQCLMEQLKPKGVVVANNDDKKSVRILRDAGTRVITYGSRGPADVTVKTIGREIGMDTLMITQGDTSAVMETALTGAAMASNHCAAAVVGLLIDQPLQQIAASLTRLRSLPGRFERCCQEDCAEVIVDVAGSPRRAEIAMQSAKAVKRGQLWCVLAVDGNEDTENLCRYGSILERYSNKTIVTCHRNSKESFLNASHHLLDGVERCASMRLVADHQRAIEWAVSNARPNDTILLLGGVSSSNANAQRVEIEQIKRWTRASQAGEQVKLVTGKEGDEEPRILPMVKP